MNRKESYYFTKDTGVLISDADPYTATIVKEMQHRMKNYLQLILSLINMQKQETGFIDNAGFLDNLKERVYALSLVNEDINSTFEDTRTDLGKLLTQISENIKNAYRKRKDIILLKYFEPVYVDNKIAVPLSMIATELLINAFKYAFPDDYKPGDTENCEIRIVLWIVERKLVLEISDNGNSKGSNPVGKTTKKQGSSIITCLAEQIDAKIKINKDFGTSVKLIIENY